MFEICVNKSCKRAQAKEEFPVGTSICPECGGDLEARDPQQPGGLTSQPGVVSQAVAGFFNAATQSLFGAPASQVQAQAIKDTKKVTITIAAIIPHMFPVAEQVSYAFIFAENGDARAEKTIPVIGDIANGEVTLGALQPAMSSRPSLDLASWCAFSPNFAADGTRIPVAVSRIMAVIFVENDRVMLKAATASNRPHPVSVDSLGQFSAGHSMAANEEVTLNDGDIYIMGDFVFQFNVADC